MKNYKVFVDVDGTLNSYSDANDKVNCSEFPANFFLNRKPVIPVIDKINELFDDVAILSAVPHYRGIIEKHKWLDKYFNVNERHFIKWKEETKAQYIEDYCDVYGIDLEDVILIDDDHEILKQVEKLGCQVYHISRLLTLEKEDLK